MSQFARNLSNLRSQQYSLPYIVSTSDLVVMQTLVYTGTIHLHRDTLDIQRQSYEKCALAANAVTTLIGQLSESDYDLICPIISVSARVLFTATCPVSVDIERRDH